MEIENWISCLRLEFNLFRELLLLLLLLVRWFVRLNTISRSRPVIVTSNCRRINSKISQIKTTLKLRHVYRTKQQRQQPVTRESRDQSFFGSVRFGQYKCPKTLGNELIRMVMVVVVRGARGSLLCSFHGTSTNRTAWHGHGYFIIFKPRWDHLGGGAR